MLWENPDIFCDYFFYVGMIFIYLLILGLKEKWAGYTKFSNLYTYPTF